MCFFRKTKFVKTNLNISSKEVIYFQPFKRNKIYLGTKVKVPRNFSFVFTSNGKVLDEINDDFVISFNEIPETTQYLKLYKVNKKGKGLKFFKAETYFVNKNIFENFEWNSYNIELEDRDFGAYKAQAFGTINFKVINPKKIIIFLYNQLGVITTTQSQKVLHNYICEKISHIIDKENPATKKLYYKDENLLKTIFSKLQKDLNEIGIDLLKINLISSKFSSHVTSVLSKLEKKPENIKSFESVSFKEWQEKNSTIEDSKKKPKFVTIIPSGKKSHFFKESMAPYFFDDDEINEDEKEDFNNKKEKNKRKLIWKNIDQISKEEKDKKIVDLNNEDD